MLQAAWLGAMVRNLFDSLVAPFDLAIVFLVLALGSMVAMWSENTGASTWDSTSSMCGSKLGEAAYILRHDRKIVLLGLIQSCFEAAMYIFGQFQMKTAR